MTFEKVKLKNLSIDIHEDIKKVVKVSNNKESFERNTPKREQIMMMYKPQYPSHTLYEKAKIKWPKEQSPCTTHKHF